MTIRKGEEWGTAVDRPAGLQSVDSDAEAARLLTQSSSPAVGVTAGDLHRAVGAPTPRKSMQRLPIDLIEVEADATSATAVAHVVARRGWWRGRVVAVMNVDHLGRWNVAPRAHPNDGRLDVIEVDPAMGVRARWQARTRLPTGTHVPHPSISTRQIRDATWEFERPVAIWVDGRRIGSSRRLSVRVRPDAGAVYV